MTRYERSINMNREWPYAQLVAKAKKAGGPENFTDSLVCSGVNYGRTTMVPWLGVAFLGGCLSMKICGLIYEKIKERRKNDLEEKREQLKEMNKESLMEGKNNEQNVG